MKVVDEEAMKMRVMLAVSVEYWMRRYNMSIAKAAEESGVGNRMLRRIIKCETAANIDAIGKLAKCFKIRPSTLLRDVPEGDE